ncbi:hypothetical protein M0657_008383 [Pyricularia oryzae]|nr:hypothetical protein M9X92_008059 [Pyricularia oryzae]KAI7916834.1 hypothetical protein M0657_008383 [Pyricularia oryzae]
MISAVCHSAQVSLGSLLPNLSPSEHMIDSAYISTGSSRLGWLVGSTIYAWNRQPKVLSIRKG